VPCRTPSLSPGKNMRSHDKVAVKPPELEYNPTDYSEVGNENGIQSLRRLSQNRPHVIHRTGCIKGLRVTTINFIELRDVQSRLGILHS
jgi:hypothetical protein